MIIFIDQSNLTKMDNWDTLITFTYPHEAHVAKGFLESEGIETLIQDEMTTQVKNFLSNAIGGVKLLVRNEDYERGIAILKQGGYIFDEGHETEEASIVYVNEANKNKTLCPFCQSDNIMKNKDINILTPILYITLGAFIPIFRPKYKCYDCEKEWRYKKART